MSGEHCMYGSGMRLVFKQLWVLRVKLLSVGNGIIEYWNETICALCHHRQRGTHSRSVAALLTLWKGTFLQRPRTRPVPPQKGMCSCYSTLQHIALCRCCVRLEGELKNFTHTHTRTHTRTYAHTHTVTCFKATTLLHNDSHKWTSHLLLV